MPNLIPAGFSIEVRPKTEAARRVLSDPAAVRKLITAALGRLTDADYSLEVWRVSVPGEGK